MEETQKTINVLVIDYAANPDYDPDKTKGKIWDICNLDRREFINTDLVWSLTDHKFTDWKKFVKESERQFIETFNKKHDEEPGKESIPPYDYLRQTPMKPESLSDYDLIVIHESGGDDPEILKKFKAKNADIPVILPNYMLEEIAFMSTDQVDLEAFLLPNEGENVYWLNLDEGPMDEIKKFIEVFFGLK